TSSMLATWTLTFHRHALRRARSPSWRAIDGSSARLRSLAFLKTTGPDSPVWKATFCSRSLTNDFPCRRLSLLMFNAYRHGTFGLRISPNYARLGLSPKSHRTARSQPRCPEGAGSAPSSAHQQTVLAEDCLW